MFRNKVSTSEVRRHSQKGTFNRSNLGQKTGSNHKIKAESLIQLDKLKVQLTQYLRKISVSKIKEETTNHGQKIYESTRMHDSNVIKNKLNTTNYLRHWREAKGHKGKLKAREHEPDGQIVKTHKKSFTIKQMRPENKTAIDFQQASMNFLNKQKNSFSHFYARQNRFDNRRNKSVLARNPFECSVFSVNIYSLSKMNNKNLSEELEPWTSKQQAFPDDIL